MSDHKDSDVPRQVQQGGLESERSKAPAPSKSAPNEVWESKCLAQATVLLNCAANGGKKIGYNEIKCQNLLRALRTCCEAEGVVDFTLIRGASESGSQKPAAK
uniref:Uncharacterized protein n=1 Tax=Tetraselmis chuii TaxID=63592 RepID=A0A6U1KSF7_9CHLO|mmetsp:Transcript_5559/g.9983  ORF Transcript_5559/g.9983 Transcript_5559/m.9983 type:complete len:103 (+) Transcript_5559:346-654(+)